MRVWLIIFLVPCFYSSNGADKKYPARDIPESLKENANVIVREREQTFTIISRDRARYNVHEVYTILNDPGKRYGIEIIPYSKLQRVTRFEGMVYDAEGELIRKLKQSEIHDQSAISGFSLYEDNRLKGADLTQGTYPYTVEFTYEVEYSFLFYIPSFELVDKEGIAVEKSQYRLIAPNGLQPRYKLVNTDQQPVVSSLNGMKALTWRFDLARAYKEEPLGPEISRVVPSILAGPTEFTFETYSGKMDSWDNFGKWIQLLNKERGDLPEPTKKEIQELTRDLNAEEKVRRVYNYLQNKTRYVSIQIGIGGFQPFDAKVVDETGYGDCKALSNYTVALLSAAGVKGNYVLIRAGRGAMPLVNDFPSTQFNHAVVAVPNGRDTLWLECTSQSNPFGYAGTFTGDRNALMITDNGAAIVRTPLYKTEQNKLIRTADVFLASTGNAKADVRTTYSGLQFENNGLSFILNDQRDDQKKWIQKNTNVPSFNLESFSVSFINDRIPTATIEMKIDLPKFANVTGKRTFVVPNLMNRSSFALSHVQERKSSIVRDIGTVDIDTIVYHLPDGIYPESLPESVRIDSPFGQYEASYSMDAGILKYTRRLRLNKGTFEPGTYSKLINFYREISRADNTKVVFLSKT